VIATQRPGRREHSNARALDVFEANDIWALDVPYVIGVGMTAEEWPQPSRSPLPPEFQEAILRGGATGTLAPQPAWVGGRDRDQLGDVLRAAGGASSSPDIPERPAATTWPAPRCSITSIRGGSLKMPGGG